jgi:hypothetical protein
VAERAGGQPRSRQRVSLAAAAAGDGRSQGAAAGPGARRPDRPAAIGQPAGLEALRLAVHQPDQVAHLLEPWLFLDPTQRTAFEALLGADDLHGAVVQATEVDPAAGELLRRVAVEEPTADGPSVAAQLVRVAARRALHRMDRQARVSPERFAELAGETAAVRRDLEWVEAEPPDGPALTRLVAWLGRRGEEDA